MLTPKMNVASSAFSSLHGTGTQASSLHNILSEKPTATRSTTALSQLARSTAATAVSVAVPSSVIDALATPEDAVMQRMPTGAVVGFGGMLPSQGLTEQVLDTTLFKAHPMVPLMAGTSSVWLAIYAAFQGNDFLSTSPRTIT